MELIEKKRCLTCGACSVVCPINAITFREIKGFMYPEIKHDLCVGCGKCSSVCPAKNPGIVENVSTKLYTFVHNDLDIVKKSSSGGFFSAISEYVLTQNGIVFGAGYTDSFSVKHMAVTSLNELNLLRKSKYVASDITEVYSLLKQHLDQGQIVLFTGVPCQVDAIKKYCIVEKLDMSNLILCALVCHGYPSPLIWRDYLSFQSVEHGNMPKYIDFRDKREGWHNQKTTIIFDGKEYDLEDYMSLYFSNLCNRESCYSCSYTTLNRGFDITIGDFWNINKCDKELNNNIGLSMVFTHSIKGEYLIEKCRQYGEIHMLADNMIKSASQPALIHPYSKPIEYELFWKEYENHKFDYMVSKYTKVDCLSRIKRKIRRVILKIASR